MSRLGDLIKLERTRQGLTHKQVAKKCGVSDKYLMEVEAGTRIIGDDQARRILKTIGMKAHTEAEFTLEDIAATVDLQSAVPQLQRAAEPKKQEAPKAKKEDDTVAGSIWLDALSSVLKRVPVYNAVMKEVDHRMLPVVGGKICGAAADKVYYMVAPDNALRGFRVQKGDYLLVVPAQAPVDGSIMVLKTAGGYMLRKVKVMPRFQAMLQKYDTEYESELKNFSDLTVVGRCVRLEVDL